MKLDGLAIDFNQRARLHERKRLLLRMLLVCERMHPTMILRRLRLYCNRARLVRLVDRIANRSQQAVWLRVRDRVTTMSRPAAQGYIRVRAAAVIEREAGIAAAEETELDAHYWPFIVQAARHRVVRRTLVDAARLREAQRAARRVA